MQILCGLQVVFFLFNCQTPGIQAAASFRAKRKPPQIFLRRPLYFFFVAIVILPDFHSVFLCLLVSSFRKNEKRESRSPPNRLPISQPGQRPSIAPKPSGGACGDSAGRIPSPRPPSPTSRNTDTAAPTASGIPGCRSA